MYNFIFFELYMYNFIFFELYMYNFIFSSYTCIVLFVFVRYISIHHSYTFSIFPVSQPSFEYMFAFFIIPWMSFELHFFRWPCSIINFLFRALHGNVDKPIHGLLGGNMIFLFLTLVKNKLETYYGVPIELYVVITLVIQTVMKSYEVKQISTILSQFYNLEKMKNICFYCIENTIFLNYSCWAASKCFFCKMSGFHRFHGWGNVQLVFKQSRPLWERAFLGALCTCNGLVCSLQSHLCSFFSFYKDQKKTNKKKNKTQQTASDPLPLGCAILFFLLFFLVSWCFAFLVRCFFWGAGKKVAGSNSCHFFPLRHCKFVCGCFCLL